MKHMKKIVLGLVILMTVALIGCRNAPIYSVEEAPIDVGSGVTMADIKKAIISAGAQYGWAMKETEPGHIVGTQSRRGHLAKVDIPYSKSSYSILYKDSNNLKYDGETIHKQYNSWIQYLDTAIQARISML